jgi:hypothetical protein
MLEKEFVPYEEALALKELGFDEPCNTCYDKLEMVASYGASVFDYKNYNTSGYMVSRPTFSQAFRWFRYKHNLNPLIAFCEYAIESENAWKYTLDNPTKILMWDGKFNTYEEAELACLKKLIEIKNEQQ